MLVPKRVKFRREFRGKMRGEAKGGKEVTFGTYWPWRASRVLSVCRGME